MFDGFELEEKNRIIQDVFKKKLNNSVLAFTNDPLIMKSCDRIILLANGIVVAEGDYDTISKHSLFVHTQL